MYKNMERIAHKADDEEEEREFDMAVVEVPPFSRKPHAVSVEYSDHVSVHY
jgi:hypothetical protein